MADGGIKGGEDNNSMLEYVYRFPGQIRDFLDRKCGACVPDSENNSDALVTVKYATAFLRFTQAAGVLTLTSGEKKATLLTKGYGESASDAGGAGNLTVADTNAFKEGSLVTTGQRFQIISAGWELMDPFEYDAGAADRTKRVWMDGYRPDLLRAVMRDVVWRIKPAESKNEYDMGCISHYPCHTASPSVGDSFVQVGAPLPNAPIPLRAMVVSGSKIESRRIEIYVDVASTIIIDAKSDPATADVVVPVKLHLLGRPVRGLGGDDTSGDDRIARVESRVESLITALESRLKG